MENLTLQSIRDKKERIEKLNFDFTTIELKENKFGKFDLLVSKVKITDENGKYIKFSKIDEDLLKDLIAKGVVTIKKQ